MCSSSMGNWRKFVMGNVVLGENGIERVMVEGHHLAAMFLGLLQMRLEFKRWKGYLAPLAANDPQPFVNDQSKLIKVWMANDLWLS